MKRIEEFLAGMLMIVMIFAPPIGWAALCSYIAHYCGLAWWGAVPVGILVGVVLHVVTGCDLGGSSPLEMGVGSLIALGIACCLLPVLGQARQKAQANACRDHLKQLRRGFVEYQIEHDGKLPAAKIWRRVVTPYANGAGIFRCPASKHAYQYEQGHNSILLIDDTPAHGERKMALFTDGRVQLLPAPAPAPTPKPNPEIRVATTSRRAGDSR